MKRLLCIFALIYLVNAYSNDSLLIVQKVDELKASIRSGDDSVDVKLNSFYDYALEKNNRFALANFHFLKGYQNLNKGDGEKAVENYKLSVKVLEDSSSAFAIDLLNRIANCYKDLSVADQALFYYQRALELALKTDYFKGCADSYVGTGQLLENRGEYEQSMKYYLMGKDYFVKCNDSTGIASSYNNLGNSMYYQGDYEQAMLYYKKSVRIDYLRKNDENMAFGYGNIAMIYHSMGQLDSALFYNTLCMSKLEQINNLFALGTIYNNIALVYFDLKDLKKSLEFHERSKKIKEAIGDKSGLATSDINIGNLYVKLEKYTTAIPYYEEGVVLSEEIESPLLAMNAYNGLAKVYEELGNYYQAFEMFKHYSYINDSLNDVELKKNVAALEAEFEAKQKDDLLKQQEIDHRKELSLKEAQKKTQNILLGSALLVLIIVAIFGIIVYRKLVQSKRQERIIKEKNTENELLLSEIHHRVKNNLQVVSSLLSLHEKSISDEVAKKAILEGKERVRSMGLIHKMLYQNDNFSGIEMNEYCKNLILGLLDSFGYSHSDFEVDMEFAPIRLDVDTAIPLGLIINELVINALKYAYVKTDQRKILVKLTEQDSQLVLEVADNGEGKASEVEKSESFGYKLIKSLVRQLSGELSVHDVRGLSYRIKIRDYKIV